MSSRLAADRRQDLAQRFVLFRVAVETGFALRVVYEQLVKGVQPICDISFPEWLRLPADAADVPMHSPGFEYRHLSLPPVDRRPLARRLQSKPEIGNELIQPMFDGHGGLGQAFVQTIDKFQVLYVPDQNAENAVTVRRLGDFADDLTHRGAVEKNITREKLVVRTAVKMFQPNTHCRAGKRFGAGARNQRRGRLELARVSGRLAVLCRRRLAFERERDPSRRRTFRQLDVYFG